MLSNETKDTQGIVIHVYAAITDIADLAMQISPPPNSKAPCLKT